MKVNERVYFLNTDRIGFSLWRESDSDLARLLWGNGEVTKYISKDGFFTEKEILLRLESEIKSQAENSVQYWPMFEKKSGEFIGCCGLKKRDERGYETGFHLRSEFWGKGFAFEGASAVINYAFENLRCEYLFAGHNPKNERSKKLLLSLGFQYIGDEFYEPTGLFHPSYELRK